MKCRWRVAAMLMNRCQENLSIKQKDAYEVVGACHVMKRFVVLCAIVLISKLSAKMAKTKYLNNCPDAKFVR